jgi:hypothetical protein
MELDTSPSFNYVILPLCREVAAKVSYTNGKQLGSTKIKKATSANYTFLEGMCNVKSLNIWTSGRDGYLKLTLVKSILPVTFSNIRPSSLIVSILDFRSRILKTEMAESLAFVALDANALACETPTAAKTRAKNT